MNHDLETDAKVTPVDIPWLLRKSVVLSPLLPHGRWGVALASFGLMACATSDTASVKPVPQTTTIIAAPVAPAAPAKPRIDIASFLNGSAENLEVLVGQPALVRNAGAYEFRRYNVNDCRILAVLAKDEAGVLKVSDLTVGDAHAAGPARDINSCT